MPQTPYKGLEIPATGTLPDTWGTVFNDSVTSTVDSNLGGLVEKTMSSSSVTLSAAEARNAMIRLTGSVTAVINLSTPAQGFYMVENLCTDGGGGEIILTQGLALASPTIPFATRALVFADTANGVRIFGLATLTNPDAVPTGTQMLFVSAAVPAGWTLYTSLDDYALALSSVAGGNPSGSVAFSTLFARTATDAFALDVGGYLPSHSHTLTLDTANGGGSNTTARWSSGVTQFGSSQQFTDFAGGAASHTHPIDMRVLHVTTIIGIRA